MFLVNVTKLHLCCTGRSWDICDSQNIDLLASNKYTQIVLYYLPMSLLLPLMQHAATIYVPVSCVYML